MPIFINGEWNFLVPLEMAKFRVYYRWIRKIRVYSFTLWAVRAKPSSSLKLASSIDSLILGTYSPEIHHIIKKFCQNSFDMKPVAHPRAQFTAHSFFDCSFLLDEKRNSEPCKFEQSVSWSKSPRNLVSAK